MEKPFVFLSHSSKDKRELIALKAALERRANGLIQFFLSSDGESIPLGTNWVIELNKALGETKLMFVFVSRAALESDWIVFEAGYALGRTAGAHVVPICLPGLDPKDLPSPFQQLQGHKLHSTGDLGRLIEKCNSLFGTELASRFNSKEFSAIFRQPAVLDEGQAGKVWDALAKEITLEIDGAPGGVDAFRQICRRKGLNPIFERPRGAHWTEVTAAGISVRENAEWFDPQEGQVEGKPHRRYAFTLSPKTLSVTAPLVDTWRRKLKLRDLLAIEVDLVFGVDRELRPHELTSKLHGSAIEVLDIDMLKYREIRFLISRRAASHDDRHAHLRIFGADRLSEIPFAELLLVLVQRQVFMLDNEQHRLVYGRKSRPA